MIAFDLWPRMIADDLVMKLPLTDGGTIQASPALAGLVEGALDLVQNLLCPIFVKPDCCAQDILDARNKLISLVQCGCAVRGAFQITNNRVLYREGVFTIGWYEVENGGECLAEVGLGHFHPEGVDVRSHQIPIADVDARRRHKTGDHLIRLSEIILVVWAATGAIGIHQCRLPAATGPTTALRIIGRCWRNVAQIDQVQLSYVYAQFHRRGAEKERQIGGAESFLPLFPVFGRYLGCVLARLKHALQIHKTAITLHEVSVDFGRDLASRQESRPIKGANLAFRRQPTEGIGVDLIAWDIAASHLLDNAVSLEREKKKADGLVDFIAAKILALWRIGRQGSL